jgi:hypothetical protein
MTDITTLSRTHVDFVPAVLARLRDGEPGPLLAAIRIMGTTMIAFITLMSIALF